MLVSTTLASQFCDVQESFLIQKARVKEKRESNHDCSKQYRGWEKNIYEVREDFSITEEKQVALKTFFSLLSLLNPNSFLSYYAIYLTAFLSLVIKDNSKCTFLLLILLPMLWSAWSVKLIHSNSLGWIILEENKLIS